MKHFWQEGFPKVVECPLVWTDGPEFAGRPQKVRTDELYYDAYGLRDDGKYFMASVKSEGPDAAKHQHSLSLLDKCLEAPCE